MATWGDSNRRSRRDDRGEAPARGRSASPSSGSRASSKGSSASSAGGGSARSSGGKAASSARSGGDVAPKPSVRGGRAPAPETPPRGTDRSSARAASGRRSPDAGDDTSRHNPSTSELRHAVEGREHEFLGIGLIVLGVLLGLAIYVDLAGPLGAGVEAVVGWFTGLARFVLPPVLVAGGVAVVRRGRSGHPFRLVLGWTITTFAVLGLLHIAAGPTSVFDHLDEVDGAGGLLGAAVGGPLRSLLRDLASVVVLAASLLVGVMFISKASVRTMAGHTGRGVGAALSSLRRPRRAAADEVPTLYDGEADLDERPATPAPTVAMRTETVAPYDLAADDEFAPAPKAPKPARPRPAKVPAEAAPGEQAELDLGPGAQKGKWVLPPMNHLGRSASQTINQAEVDARGRMLVESLASHGVETRLVGQTVGPTVTRYELELGSGVKVARITS
ncbi:MAG: DNA translocase FtsK 4TM domain-containing protein, partial [Ilumatobacteraceae bacterium]